MWAVDERRIEEGMKAGFGRGRDLRKDQQL